MGSFVPYHARRFETTASQELTGTGGKGDISVLHPRVIEKTRADNVSGMSDSSKSDGVESPSLTSGGSLSNIGAESDDGKSDSIIPSSSESNDSQVDVDPRAPVATKTTTPVRRVVPAAAATPAGRATVVTSSRRAASALNTPDGRRDEPAENQDSGASAGSSVVSDRPERSSSSSSRKGENDKATSVLRGRAAAQLQWFGPGPTGIVRTRTRRGGYGPRPIDEALLAAHV